MDEGLIFEILREYLNDLTSISRERVTAIKRMLEKMSFVILGEQTYKQLTDESTKIYPVLARYQIEVLNNKSNKTH